ncbi:MAG: tyrosine-type recombinase/integrase [Bacteroidota bacterium]|nr:tyrosine-type recombinase/integrase [Bacteroidota bacterium]
MLSLEITSHHYKYLLVGYKEFLQILGYSPQVVKNWPRYVQEFFNWLENKHIGSITNVTGLQQLDFMDYLQRRQNKRTAGALHGGSINNIVSAIYALARYVNSTGRYVFDIVLERVSNESAERNILNIEQIKKIYEATFLPYPYNQTAMGQRDRAIIALYYGCGLRRTEGVQLNINDIDLHKRLLFVRKGKGNKQRYVPIAAKHITDIGDYLKEGREWFLYEHHSKYQYYSDRDGNPTPKKENPDTEAFLISKYAQRLDQPEKRLQYLLKCAELPNSITLHGLRHSIATHLLQSGMSIEDIAKFLGHSSLSSTQIYTHIVNDNRHE